MKIRRIVATFRHTESQRVETKTVLCLIPNDYVITKAFVFEEQRWLLFDAEMNEFLIPD